MDRAPVEQALTAHFAAEYGDVNYEWQCDIQASRVQPQLKRLMGVKNILAIASGKGGVGKSTVTANLALALHKQGARVGILDADLFGPSMPLMLGNKQKPALVDGKFFEPVSAHGIQMISIGSM
ncbi:MAG: P-loop NTPase, partial [Moraxella osloensis]|nr:P-loop NTPase [Moraxella osloensis]